jgi:hypothetical protein
VARGAGGSAAAAAAAAEEEEAVFLGAGCGLLKSLADFSSALSWRTTVRAKDSRIGDAYPSISTDACSSGLRKDPEAIPLTLSTLALLYTPINAL